MKNTPDDFDVLGLFKEAGIQLPARKETETIIEKGNFRLIIEKITKQANSDKSASVIEIDDIFVPPDSIPVKIDKSGENTFENKFSPRSQVLINILIENKQKYLQFVGTNSKNMLRKESYQMFIVPDLGKMVLICNETGNLTFVFHFFSEKPREWFKKSKNQLLTFSEDNPSALSHIKWDPQTAVDQLTQELFSKPIFQNEIIPTINKDDVKKIEQAPEGWRTASNLREKEKVGPDTATIKNFVAKYRDVYPEWFRVFPAGNNQTEHYHPDLVKIIKEGLSIEQAPEGWRTASNLSKKEKIGSDAKTIKNFVAKYRDVYPEWFRVFPTSGVGKKTEHYHPDLVKIVKESFKKSEK